MTQEQLAEAMGVSASAVYKWESNQSMPEINLILEMADLFHTSTDVLLGYEWRSNNAVAALDRIVTLTKAKEYGEALTEAEKALKNYPNNFDIVYQSALLYLELGKDAVSRAAHYDNAAPKEIADIKFFTTLGIERQPTYPDRYGKTAMDCLLRRIPPDDNLIPGLRRLWLEVTKEVFPNETV